jgi:hypothetical protein
MSGSRAVGSTITDQPKIERHRTAMKRYSLSRPLALAMSHHLISPSSKVLDYGCGRGADIRLLQKAGIPASGWDPHFRPDDPLLPADCVNLGYVLNVIEDPAERAATLHNAFQLAEKVLNLLALHPTVKPVSMVADALLDCTRPGGLVLDSFLGSGSTLIASERTGRICHGIELDPLYVDTAILRWKRYTGGTAIHAESGRQFREVACG